MAEEPRVYVFTSVQGEGLHLGEPSLFVRFTGCNLKCEHCDTKYAWLRRGDAFPGAVEFEEALAAVRTSELGALVITGGEPLLWQEHVYRLASAARLRSMRVTVETNGTYPPSIDLQQLEVTWSVSPKLPWFLGKGYAAEFALRAFPVGYLKVVVRPYKKDVVGAIAFADAARPSEISRTLILQPANPLAHKAVPEREWGNVMRSYWLRYAKIVEIASRCASEFMGVLYVRPQIHVLAGLR